MKKSTAVPSASPARIVTLASVSFRVLFMSGQTHDAAEFLEAWSQTVPAQSFHPAEVFHFSFSSPPNVLSALALLDSVQKGCFHAVIMMPPAASWSRLTHLADESQCPLRTRAFPLGLPELDAEAVSKTQCSNRQLEVTSWICEQAAQCKNRRVPILLSFPEDFAGHVSHGPASPWASKISAIYNSTPVKSNGARSTCAASRALNSVALWVAGQTSEPYSKKVTHSGPVVSSTLHSSSTRDSFPVPARASHSACL